MQTNAADQPAERNELAPGSESAELAALAAELGRLRSRVEDHPEELSELERRLDEARVKSRLAANQNELLAKPWPPRASRSWRCGRKSSGWLPPRPVWVFLWSG